MSRPNTPFLPLIGQEDAGQYLNHKLVPSLQKILGSVAQQSTNATQSISLIGNTSGATAITGAQLYFAGGNNVTLSGSSNSITISAAGGGAVSVDLIGHTSGFSAITANTLFLAGGNNITLSGSAGSITISGGAASFGVSSLGNTLGATGTVSNQIVFAGGNNVTLSQSTNATGATVTISAAGGGGNVSVNLAGNTAGTSTVTGASVLLAGGNNITLSGDGTQVTIVGPSTAAQTDQTLGFYVVGNTASTSTSTTLDARTLSFRGAGEASVGFSNGSVIFSAPGQSIGVSNLGNTAGNTGTQAGQVVFAGAGNITLSQATGASAAGTISISGPQTVMLSQFEPVPFYTGISTLVGLGQQSLFIAPFQLNQSASFCQLNWYAIMSGITGITAGTNSTGGKSNSFAWTESFGVYTRGTAGSTDSIFLLSSTSWSQGLFQSVSVSINGSSLRMSQTYGGAWVTKVDSAGGATYSTGTFSSSISTNTTAQTSVTQTVTGSGLFKSNPPSMAVAGWALSLTPGDYWFGRLGATGATSAGTAVTLASISRVSIAGPGFISRFGAGGAVATTQAMNGIGTYTAATGALPAAIGFTELVGGNSFIRDWFYLVNQTIS